jgi:hypothetical protein
MVVVYLYHHYKMMWVLCSYLDKTHTQVLSHQTFSTMGQNLQTNNYSHFSENKH